MIPFISWLAGRGVDQAAWAGMSLHMQNQIKAAYEQAVPANQREYNLGAGFENIDPTRTVITTNGDEGGDTFDLADIGYLVNKPYILR